MNIITLAKPSFVLHISKIKTLFFPNENNTLVRYIAASHIVPSIQSTGEISCPKGQTVIIQVDGCKVIYQPSPQVF